MASFEAEGGQDFIDYRHFFRHVQAPAFRFKACKETKAILLPSQLKDHSEAHSWAYDFVEPDSQIGPEVEGRVELSFLKTSAGKPRVVFSFGRVNSRTQGSLERLPQDRSLRYFLVFSVGTRGQAGVETPDAFKLPFVLLKSKRFFDEWFEEAPARTQPMQQWEKNTAKTLLLRIRDRLGENPALLPVLEKPWWHSVRAIVPKSEEKIAAFNLRRDAALAARRHVLSVLKSL